MARSVPRPPGAADPPGGVVEQDRPCLSCGYNLRGLALGAACPECGSPVARSLRGNLLKFSSPAYVEVLHRGVFVIEASLVVQLLATIANLALGIAAGLGSGLVPPAALVAAALAGSLASVGSAVGWWVFSAPDPALAGSATGVTARKLVRVTVLISAASAMAGAYSTAAGGAPPLAEAGKATLRGGAALLTLTLHGAALIAWVVWFFAAMRYLRWVSARLPDPRVRNRAELLSWLGPVLWVFGCGVGQLVALVLYYLLLDRVRSGLVAIRATQRTEPGPLAA